jgi:hypothetical protein
MKGFGGPEVDVRYSAGRSRVPYVTRWQDNVLRSPTGEGWPAALLNQVKDYPALKSWFSSADAVALSADLGCISKFQSLNSEDAVTWSWFGTLGLALPEQRRASVQWLYDRIGLDAIASPEAQIDQWGRVYHPNAPGSQNGPELDARIDDPASALIYVEAKWNAGLGAGKGAEDGQRDDQVILRRDSLRNDPKLKADARHRVVLGVSNNVPDLGIYDEAENQVPVLIAWLTWEDLAECASHPLADEFTRYLAWKREAAATMSR